MACEGYPQKDSGSCPRPALPNPSRAVGMIPCILLRLFFVVVTLSSVLQLGLGQNITLTPPDTSIAVNTTLSVVDFRVGTNASIAVCTAAEGDPTQSLELINTNTGVVVASASGNGTVVAREFLLLSLSHNGIYECQSGTHRSSRQLQVVIFETLSFTEYPPDFMYVSRSSGVGAKFNCCAQGYPEVHVTAAINSVQLSGNSVQIAIGPGSEPNFRTCFQGDLQNTPTLFTQDNFLLNCTAQYTGLFCTGGSGACSPLLGSHVEVFAYDTPLPQQTAYHPKGISIISASPLPSCTPTSVSSILVLINTNTSRVFHQVQPTGGMATLPEDGSLSLSDSGIYICAGPAANTSYSFHLIVFETIQLAVALPSVISGYQTTRYNQTCCFSSYPNVSINYVTNAPNRSFTVVKSIIANNQNILTCLFFSFFMPDVLTGPSEQLSLSCEATYLQSFCQMPSAVGHAEPCRTASTMLAFPDSFCPALTFPLAPWDNYSRFVGARSHVSCEDYFLPSFASPITCLVDQTGNLSWFPPPICAPIGTSPSGTAASSTVNSLSPTPLSYTPPVNELNEGEGDKGKIIGGLVGGAIFLACCAVGVIYAVKCRRRAGRKRSWGSTIQMLLPGVSSVRYAVSDNGDTKINLNEDDRLGLLLMNAAAATEATQTEDSLGHLQNSVVTLNAAQKQGKTSDGAFGNEYARTSRVDPSKVEDWQMYDTTTMPFTNAAVDDQQSSAYPGVAATDKLHPAALQTTPRCADSSFDSFTDASLLVPSSSGARLSFEDHCYSSSSNRSPVAYSQLKALPDKMNADAMSPDVAASYSQPQEMAVLEISPNEPLLSPGTPQPGSPGYLRPREDLAEFSSKSPNVSAHDTYDKAQRKVLNSPHGLQPYESTSLLPSPGNEDAARHSDDCQSGARTPESMQYSLYQGGTPNTMYSPSAEPGKYSEVSHQKGHESHLYSSASHRRPGSALYAAVKSPSRTSRRHEEEPAQASEGSTYNRLQPGVECYSIAKTCELQSSHK